MKFRVIQSNNRGLISKVGDQTFHSRKPKRGEENKDLPTLFIWVNSPYRYVARAWTKWTGGKIDNDFIYEVTKFRNVIDISGMNHFHQWSNQELRMKLWKMKGKEINIENLTCPKPEQVWEGSRNKHIKSLKKRKNFIASQLKKLSKEEKELINNLYQEKNRLNTMAGFIKFHVDHIQPLSKGGLHKFNNLRIITANENLKKGSKILG
tara:strand:+ start:286 stop:909 length:624 start_codon:yes stop_codon:yes gene_type:complete